MPCHGKPSRQTPRAATAYHEAGHAVIAYLKGIVFDEVTIKGDERAGNDGHLQLERFNPQSVDKMTSRVRTRIEGLAMLALAGVRAEERFLGRRVRTGHEQDVRDAEDLLRYVHEPAKVRSTYLAYLGQRVTALLDAPEVWAAVRAVAKRLIEKDALGYGEVCRVISAASPFLRRTFGTH